MATGDITNIEVAASGKTISFDIEGLTYGSVTKIETGKSITVSCTSEGYSNAGVLGTVARTNIKCVWYGPNATAADAGGGNCTVTLWLREPIHDDDVDVTIDIAAGSFSDGSNSNNVVSGGSATNSSTLDYPQLVGMLGITHYQILEGTVEIPVFSMCPSWYPSAASTTPGDMGVACVTINLNDGGDNIQTITSPSKYQVTPTGSPAYGTAPTYVPEFVGSFDTTSLTDGALTSTIVCYPKIGDADSIITITPTFYANGGGTLTKYYAYVDGTGPDPGTVSSVEATAAADPFASIGQAIKAAAVAGRQNVVIKVAPGTLTVAGSVDYTARSFTYWCTVQPYDGHDYTDTIIKPSSDQTIFSVNHLRFKNLTLDSSGYKVIGAPGAAANNYYWFDGCDIIGPGRWKDYAVFGNVQYAWLTGGSKWEKSFETIYGSYSLFLASGVWFDEIGDNCRVNSVGLGFIVTNQGSYMTDVGEITGATYIASGDPSGHNYVVRKTGAFTNYTHGEATHAYCGVDVTTNFAEVSGKIDDDAIWLASDPGFGASPASIWLMGGNASSPAHADVYQPNASSNNSNHAIVNAIIKADYQALFENDTAAGLGITRAVYANILLHPSYYNFVDFSGTSGGEFGTMGFFNCSMYSPSSYQYFSTASVASYDNLCMVGNVFSKFFVNGVEDVEPFLQDNHFVLATDACGEDKTTGSAGVDSDGLPLAGSTLIGRVASPLPFDVYGNTRASLSAVGAVAYTLEYSSTPLPKPNPKIPGLKPYQMWIAPE